MKSQIRQGYQREHIQDDSTQYFLFFAYYVPDWQRSLNKGQRSASPWSDYEND